MNRVWIRREQCYSSDPAIIAEQEAKDAAEIAMQPQGKPKAKKKAKKKASKKK